MKNLYLNDCKYMADRYQRCVVFVGLGVFFVDLGFSCMGL